MANDYTGNPIILDTFTSAINLRTGTGRTELTHPEPFKVEYILWRKPTTLNHTCQIQDGNSRMIFDEICTVANESKIIYYGGNPINNIVIAASAVQSGVIVIMLRTNPKT